MPRMLGIDKCQTNHTLKVTQQIESFGPSDYWIRKKYPFDKLLNRPCQFTKGLNFFLKKMNSYSAVSFFILLSGCQSDKLTI